jgi:hypothetical protein
LDPEWIVGGIYDGEYKRASSFSGVWLKDTPAAKKYFDVDYLTTVRKELKEGRN